LGIEPLKYEKFGKGICILDDILIYYFPQAKEGLPGFFLIGSWLIGERLEEGFFFKNFNSGFGTGKRLGFRPKFWRDWPFNSWQWGNYS